MQKRKLNRLKGYNYTQGGHYFITICTANRIEWFGKIVNKEMKLNEYGNIVAKSYNDLPNHYKNIRLDEFAIMPNHLHGIIIIENNDVGNGLKPFPTHGLSEIVRGLKTFSSRKINEKINDINKFRWQKSFYDHIIRNENELNRIREYIKNNPLQWDYDRNNVKNWPKMHPSGTQSIIFKQNLY